MLDKLNIPSVGPGAAQKLAERFGSLEGVLGGDWLDMRQALPEKQAKAVREFFDNADNAQLARAIEQQLRDFGMHWESEKKVAEGLPLAGQTWVLTGTLEVMSRDVARKSWRAWAPRWPVLSRPRPTAWWPGQVPARS